MSEKLSFSRNTDTKEKIISAAFALYSESFSKASLSNIAKRTGISKTAIYRHFKDKESLENEMFRIVYDSFFNVFKIYEKYMAEGQAEKAFSLIIEFVDKKTEYVTFYLLMNSETCQDNLIIEMKKRGSRSFDSLLNNDGSINKLDFYITNIFSLATIISFVSTKKKENSCTLSDQEFYQRVSVFILNGLGNTSPSISSIRFTELENITRNAVSGLEAPDRIIVALNSAIKKYGSKNVTIEQIASELGMAKSSLYTWFSNKNEMFQKLIFKELDTLLYTVIENQAFAVTKEERLFLILSSTLEYLNARPQLINVFQWLQLTENFGQSICREENFNLDQVTEDFFRKNPLFEKIPDLGFKSKNGQTITNWIFVIPVFTLAHGKKHNLSVDLIRASIRELFFMIEEGIKIKINLNGGIK
ncbi:TetR/AcrR family transcriptional regulator [Treponema sp.]|uniref:TetR/AcrR family transcriptional regulator n=1 Tax=Treponema sp. TaxID=166 RepID=UPI0025DC02E7|nr:TetR/AcrR family transcriptional regulator [Treponema sp.]MCR5217970.1 TetR/AcrR family transcriptional regulator [Treponema sp.]